MKCPLATFALMMTAAFVGHAYAGNDVGRNIADVRAAIELMSRQSGLLQSRAQSDAQSAEVKLAQLRQDPANWEGEVFPPLSQMPAGQVGSIPVGLALVYLGQARAMFGTGRFDKHDAAALVVSEGRLTLKQLVAAADKSFPGTFTRQADGVVVALPILVLGEAELFLEKGDKLLLDASAGSFILNVGTLRLEQASIAAHNVAADSANTSVPFIATVLGGALQARDSVFSELGDTGPADAGGVVIYGSPLSIKRQKSTLTGNTFRSVAGLSLSHTDNVEIQGNRFEQSRQFALRLANISQADIRGNLFIDGAGEQVISIGESSTDIDVRDNAILAGEGNGIHIGKSAANIQVSGNLVQGQRKDAILVDRSVCVDVQRNVVWANGGNGIVILKTRLALASDNWLVRNRGAGVFVRSQAKDAVTRIEGNSFIDNTSGIRGQAASHIDIGNNNLTAQMPVAVSGDFADASAVFLESTIATGLTRLEATSFASWDDEVAEKPSPTSVADCKNGS